MEEEENTLLEENRQQHSKMSCLKILREHERLATTTSGTFVEDLRGILVLRLFS